MKRRIANKIAEQASHMGCRKRWRFKTLHKALAKARVTAWFDSPLATIAKALSEIGFYKDWANVRREWRT